MCYKVLKDKFHLSLKTNPTSLKNRYQATQTLCRFIRTWSIKEEIQIRNFTNRIQN